MQLVAITCLIQYVIEAKTKAIGKRLLVTAIVTNSGYFQ